MNKLISGSALALSLSLCAAPAFASESDDITVLATQPDGHGPAGMMGDHTHTKGGFMVGLTWMHEDFGGESRTGTSPVSGDAIGAQGFAGYTQSMQMDMAMLHLMWAPSDRVTLMVAPSWTRMKMTMVGTGAVTTGHHAMAKGETMTETVSGMGDTQVAALVTLNRTSHRALHATLGVSIPTGSVSNKDEDGNFVHYGMQPGSGTWDLMPQLTFRGWSGNLGWGAQTAYVFRVDKKNASGFRFGDRFTATAWGSYRIAPTLSLSGRINYVTEGPVLGHYNAGHNHAVPADRQANYGGDRVEAAIGANMVVGRKSRLGIEATLPVYQRVNGIQAPKRFGLSAGLTTMY